MATTTLRRKLLKGCAYVSFYLTSVIVLSYFTFPYDRVRDYIVQEVENPRSAAGLRAPSGWRLEIDELGPYWLTGIEVSGVRMRKQPTDPEARPVVIRIDEATARVSLLSLLTGKVSVSFDIQTAGGELEGEVSKSGDESHVRAHIAQLDLRQLGLPQAMSGLPFAGRLNADIDLTTGATPAAARGQVSVKITRFVVGDANAKLKLEGMGDGLTIGRVDAGDVELAAKVEQGVLRIEKFEGNGSDLVLRGSGQIRLGRDVQSLSFDTLVSAKFSEAFRERDDRTRAIFSLIDMTPRLRQARTPDGAMQWQITGPLSRIRANGAGNRPSPGGSGRGAAGGATKNARPSR